MKLFLSRLLFGLSLAVLLVPATLEAQERDAAATPSVVPGDDSPFTSDAAATPAESSPFTVPEGPAESDLPFESGAATPAPTEIPDPFASTDPAVPFVPSDPFAQTGGVSEQPGDPFSQTTSMEQNPFSTEEPFAASSPAPVSGEAAIRSSGASIRGLYLLATQPGMQNYNQLQQLAADFTAGGFNELFAEARTVFGTAYASDFEKPLPYIQPGFASPLTEVRPLLPDGSKVVAVVWLLPSYSSTTGRTPPSTNPLGRNPGLVCQSLAGDQVAPGNKMYIDPGNPEGVAYLQNLVLEINRVVKPDAFLFRGVQYPGREWGYSGGAVQNFRSQVGGSGNPPPDDPTWMAWRRQQLAALLRDVRNVLHQTSPELSVGVMVEAGGKPPETWEEYTAAPEYADRMQDWISWCRDGVIDEIALEVHERVGAEGQYLEDWTNFLNNNCQNAKPVISLAGNLNFSSGITMQYNIVRTRGVGTILYNYDKPLRSHSRGFFASIPNLVFRNAPGRAIPGMALPGTGEERRFVRMAQPPPQVASSSPTAAVYQNPLADSPLVFASPTPVPTRTSAPAVVPADFMRRVTLVSGQKLEVRVLEVTSTSITIQQQNGVPIVIARSSVAGIEPPL